MRIALENDCDRCACELLDQRDKARAEVVKEFAARLRKEAGYFGRAVAVEDIDNLVKEMTEGNHDNT